MALNAQQRFFYKNAAYSWDPTKETQQQGREKSARRYARAENYARDHNWEFRWDTDLDGCIGCDCGSPDCACSSSKPHRVEWCQLWDGDSLLASLGGICEASSLYKRCVQAELALEAMPK